MKDSISQRLQSLEERYSKLQVDLLRAGERGDSEGLRVYGKECASLEPIVSAWRRYRAVADELKQILDLVAEEGESEIGELAASEAQELEERLQQREKEIEALLLVEEDQDVERIFIEVRAGTGGLEAALFAGDLLRLYSRYAERRGWKIDPISTSASDAGGYKEAVILVDGNDAWQRLRFEGGIHRVQRIPSTESQGRIHTSAATVAVLPVAGEVEEAKIDPSEIRVDTFRASGAGGQHVNKTDSAIRITHLPTGIVVESQDDRSQHRNRAVAMSLLRAHIIAQKEEQQQSERSAMRKNQVGSGDRSQRIRTYNFPQKRVTDHRLGLSLQSLDEILDGDLDTLIDALVAERRAQLLSGGGEADGAA